MQRRSRATCPRVQIDDNIVRPDGGLGQRPRQDVGIAGADRVCFVLDIGVIAVRPRVVVEEIDVFAGQGMNQIQKLLQLGSLCILSPCSRDDNHFF